MQISGQWKVIHHPDDGGSMTSETLVNIDHTTQRDNPEDRNLQQHDSLQILSSA
jgi:hypothetical protein